MSVNSVNWKAIGKTFSSLCRRWVNPAIRDEPEAALQAGLFAFLFALPPLTLATTLLAALDGSAPTGALAALSIALPVLAASLLSSTGAPAVRQLIVAASGPLLVLATAASGTAMATAAVIAFSGGMLRAWKRLPDWKIGLASGIAGLVAAMAMLYLKPDVLGPSSLLAALPVMFLAAILTVRRGGEIPAAPATSVQPHGDSSLVALAYHAGSILCFIDKSGVVSRSEGRSTVEGFAASSLERRGLIEKLHIADRPGFLAWIGGLTSNSAKSEFDARLANESFGWINGSFRRIREDATGLLLSLVVEGEVVPADNATQAVAIGSLGHELRTPLNAIVGFSELLRNGFCGPLTSERQTEYLDLILKSSRHLLLVSDAMLEWSQLESRIRQLNAETFLPAEAATLAIGIVSADARAKRIGLEFNPACGFEEFRGDKRSLTQILVNLFSNAIKFAPVGGQVSLAIDVDDGCLKLSVTDNGPGMQAADQARIGVPFMQSRASRSAQSTGSGLGLSIVRQLARLHGGSMQVESACGEGTCVTVALPELRPQRTNMSELRSAEPDESTRDILIFGEEGHAQNRKTA